MGGVFAGSSGPRDEQGANPIRRWNRHRARQLLDLSEAVSLNVLRDAYEEYAAMMNASSAAFPINEGGHPGDADLVKRKLDYAVINFLHTSREENGEPPFDTVRCPFFEGAPLFPGARVAERTHLQWSIRDPKKSVIGYYRPKNDAIAQ